MKCERKLVMLGYENVTQVEHPGEFAVRGGIVDIFPLTEEHPIRMELWGDEIDSLRYFDVATQKSIDSVEHVTVYPAMELVLTQEEIETGLKRMEADAEELYQKYRSLMRTEEAQFNQDRSGTTGDRDQRMGTGAWSGDTSELLCQPDGKSAFLFSAGDSGLFR